MTAGDTGLRADATAVAAPLGALVQGEGPPLVAVHGGLAGGRLSFGGVVDAWAGRHRVIVPDRPGFEGTGGDGEVPIPAQADRLLSTIRAHAEEPCHAVGFSFGGLVLLRAVQQEPALFATLTLVEVPAVDLCPGDMVEPARFQQLVRRAHDGGPGDATTLVSVFSEVDHGLGSTLGLLLAREDTGITALRSDLAIWTAQLDRHRLAEVVSGDPPIPVLAVSGSRSAPTFRTFGACTAAALSGRHEVLEGAGHAAHLHPGFGALLADHTGVRP